MQPGEALVEALAAAAQGVEQRGQLALELVEAGEHPARGLLDARDVLAGLAPGLGAQLGGARLGGLEDRAHLLGRARGQRAHGARCGLARSVSISSATRRRWASTASWS